MISTSGDTKIRVVTIDSAVVNGAEEDVCRGPDETLTRQASRSRNPAVWPPRTALSAYSGPKPVLTLYGGVPAAAAHLRLKSEEIGRAGENRPPRIAWTARNEPWPCSPPCINSGGPMDDSSQSIMNEYQKGWHIGQLNLAQDFLKAASVLLKNQENLGKMGTVITYLYGHAIELALKSILIKNGIPEKDLKGEIGHDLEKALEKANSYPEMEVFDEKLREGLREIVAMVNPVYREKLLEYHPGRPAGMCLPDESAMQRIVREFIHNLDARYRECLRAKR